MAVKLQDVGHAIKRVQHRHHRAADLRPAPLRTTLVQWDSLRHISQSPDSSSHHGIIEEILTESFAPLKPAEMKVLHELLSRLLSTDVRS